MVGLGNEDGRKKDGKLILKAFLDGDDGSWMLSCGEGGVLRKGQRVLW